MGTLSKTVSPAHEIVSTIHVTDYSASPIQRIGILRADAARSGFFVFQVCKYRNIENSDDGKRLHTSPVKAT